MLIDKGLVVLRIVLIRAFLDNFLGLMPHLLLLRRLFERINTLLLLMVGNNCVTLITRSQLLLHLGDRSAHLVLHIHVANRLYLLLRGYRAELHLGLHGTAVAEQLTVNFHSVLWLHGHYLRFLQVVQVAVSGQVD